MLNDRWLVVPNHAAEDLELVEDAARLAIDKLLAKVLVLVNVAGGDDGWRGAETVDEVGPSCPVEHPVQLLRDARRVVVLRSCCVYRRAHLWIDAEIYKFLAFCTVWQYSQFYCA